MLIRPSKLGPIASNFESQESISSPFSRGIGKRAIKPSFKLKESDAFKSPSAKLTTTTAPPPEKVVDPSPEMNLASQWSPSRLRKVENKFVKSGARVSSPNPKKDENCQPAAATAKPLLRESKLVLNQKLLERLRKPSQQVEFYQAIQRSMQSADKVPPKLVQGPAFIHPGKHDTFLVESIWFCD